MKKIFVYGTLMRGERANSMLDRGIASRCSIREPKYPQKVIQRNYGD